MTKPKQASRVLLDLDRQKYQIVCWPDGPITTVHLHPHTSLVAAMRSAALHLEEFAKELEARSDH